MARSKFRRAPRIENLESRELLSTVSASQAPSDDAQYMLQVLNMVRTNPQAAVQYLESHITPQIQTTLQDDGVNLSATLAQIGSMPAQPPLAWSASLAQAAQSHSQDMATNGFQGHNGSNGSMPPDRISADGFQGATSVGENVYAYAESVDQAMEAFLLDWGVSDAGHRTNIMQPTVSAQDAYQAVGIGLVQGTGVNGTGPLVVTQDFASQANQQAQVVGVAFNDNAGTGLDQPGEGIGGVQITAVNLTTGDVSSTQTWSSGGYQVGLNAGNYQIIASQNGQVVGSQSVTVGNVNVQANFNLLGATPGQSLSAAIAQAQANTPAATPVVIPVAQPAAAAAMQAPALNMVASAINWNWSVSSAQKASS